MYKFIDSSGREAFPMLFDDASYFDEFGWAGVRVAGRTRYIDIEGKVVLESKHEKIADFGKDGLGLLYHPQEGRDTYGILTTKDEWFIEPKYEGLGPRSDGVFCARAGKKNFLLDGQGHKFLDIAPYRFADSFGFDSGLVHVLNRKDEYFFMDQRGKIIHGPYWSAQEYCDGLASVRFTEDSTPLFINPGGEVVLRTDIYDYASEYWSDGLLQVKSGGKYGAINKSGDFPIEPIYDRLEFIIPGCYYRATIGTKRLIIKRTGEVTMEIPASITDFWPGSEGVAAYEEGGKRGYLRLQDGSRITPAIYKDAGRMCHGRAAVEFE